jgi:nicotinate phosphoribosyltransferase
VAADAPSLDSAYKLVAYAGRPVMKLSTGKVTLPGAKQVFRRDGVDDVIALREETPPPAARPLLREAMKAGRRLTSASLHDARDTVERDLAALPHSALDLRCTEPVRATVSERLRHLTDELTSTARLS